MNRTTRFLDSAERDFIEIARFVALESRSIEIGIAFTERLRSRCERFAQLPGLLGTSRPEIGDAIRSSPHKGYVILFRYTEEAVEIVNIVNGKRDLAQHAVDSET